MKPLVLVTTDVMPMGGHVWHVAIQTYLKALADVANVQPVLLPSLADATDFNSLLTRVDGVLVTGARSNVYPKIYGAEPSVKHEPYDHDRDATTLPLILAAIDSGTPLLAICRGHQELNAALGGTLETEIQEQTGRMDHRAPDITDQDERYKIVHSVTPTTGGLLAKIVGEHPIEVNSIHRQAIGRLSDRLTIEALAEDGTIEATSTTDTKAFCLSLQWHPEYWAASDDVSRKIFEYFGATVRGTDYGKIQAAE